MSHKFSAAEAEEMARHSISHRPLDYFHLGEYRYTSLKDALAAARRLERSRTGPAPASTAR